MDFNWLYTWLTIGNNQLHTLLMTVPFKFSYKDIISISKAFECMQIFFDVREWQTSCWYINTT